MINKWKKYSIFFIESPLILLGLIIKLIIALFVFMYLRLVRPGAALGKRFHTYLECHELGYKIEKKAKR